MFFTLTLYHEKGKKKKSITTQERDIKEEYYVTKLLHNTITNFN